MEGYTTVCLLSVLTVIRISATTGKFQVTTLPTFVVSLAIAVIYFSRIARKKVRESKEE
jgi:Na+/glutamate symporter